MLFFFGAGFGIGGLGVGLPPVGESGSGAGFAGTEDRAHQIISNKEDGIYHLGCCYGT